MFDLLHYEDFPEGLVKNALLPQPVVTPTTKGGPTGHDERLTPSEVVSKGYLDSGTWEAVMAAALALFERGREISSKAGLMLVDTKYEFGRAPDGRVLLIDEVHTPDSSRFWRRGSYAKRLSVGLEPELLDKEFVRLAFAERGYRGDGEIPRLPASVWEETGRLYREVYEALTGLPFQPAPEPAGPRLEANLRKAGILP
ncbi:MAG: phosphoribosylaminoimidazolesuccinocarboxamide synthase [Spirochaetota bacterium]